VVASLQGRRVAPGTPEFGELFETWLHHELASYRDYVTNEPLAYWRSTSGFEVDFLIGEHTGLEAKAKETVGAQDLRGLGALAEENRVRRPVCVSLEARRRQVGNVEIWLHREFVEALWAGEFRE
jgi:predicted AAA+ superfamily ATPase